MAAAAISAVLAMHVAAKIWQHGWARPLMSSLCFRFRNFVALGHRGLNFNGSLRRTAWRGG